MVDPVITGPLAWLLLRLLDKGFDRLVDAAVDRFDKPALSLPAAVPAMDAPRRHDLSIAGAQATTDVDIAVHHHAVHGRLPVMLTFQPGTTVQKPGTDVDAMIVPMVLGDTAHLTLRRDLYLITAMVVTHATSAGAKPTLHGIGWTREYVADNEVRKLTIATERPTETVLNDLGLRCQDGTYPFRIASTPTRKPLPAEADIGAARTAMSRALRARETARKAHESAQQMNPTGPHMAELTTSYARRRFSTLTFSSALTCRASASRDQQCQSPAGLNGLCPEHSRDVNHGHFVFDYLTGDRIWHV